MKATSPVDRLLLPPLGWLAGLASGSGLNARLFILIYHRVLSKRDPMRPGEVDATDFGRQMQLLKRYFRVLPLEDAVRRLAEGTLPRRAVAITFDDGYRDNYDIALPILEAHGLPATFFIATGFLDGGRMWNDTIIEAFRTIGESVVELPELDLPCLKLDSLSARAAAAQRVISAIKHRSFEERAAWVERVAALANDDLPNNLMMSSEQVRQMRSRGMAIGAHTVSHPILAKLSEADARREIIEGKQFLEHLLNEPVRLFAYPNGRPGYDYTERDVRLVSEASFEAAVSTNPGTSGRSTSCLELKRFTPWDRTPVRFMGRMIQYYRHDGKAA